MCIRQVIYKFGDNGNGTKLVKKNSEKLKNVRKKTYCFSRARMSENSDCFKFLFRVFFGFPHAKMMTGIGRKHD